MESQFAIDVADGLTSNPKYIPSRYFYDEKGDSIFQEIMAMPEYYLTEAEHEIISTQASEIIEGLQLKKDVFFELIELGPGDGYKTQELLIELVARDYSFEYVPVDISGNALEVLTENLTDAIPGLKIHPMQGDYFHVLEEINRSHFPKVVLFLGSNLGNYPDPQAHQLLYNLGSHMQPGDKLFLGVDLIKSESIIGPAYDDPHDITSRFNLNLLERMNRELGAKFNKKLFRHCPEYDEQEGVARSFLVSVEEQSVEISAINKTIEFDEGEKIFTEISRKYDDVIVERILKGTDFRVIGKLTDSNQYFADYILDRGQSKE